MKRALITGGSGDIGSAICRRLCSPDTHVIVHANSNPDRAESVAQSVRDKGGSAETLVFDICDTKTTLQRLLDILQQGPIQILVHNAGIHDDAPLAGMQASQWKRVIDVSLNGFYNVTQPLLLPMMATRWGRIVSISSIAGIMGNRGQSNYAAAKAGLHGATKSLAIELASRGVTANAVAPGIIAGSMSGSTFEEATIKQTVPMKRAGSPDEVASLVAFLTSEEAAYISGQVISINGAMA
ncbi:MAG: 3-oxoacyl-ACP reductase FabG [Candidatus Thiodiazotropha sp. (ex Dulcina madagascariensis)]|nr:3-oxoacyl-ACP reductase FabG [Candidatus Thiodiazotropha sp. (ex Dulcina madagascariensis)]MCU7926785.1 3-oxoacyl-ACP reductase FabG [Candidatus Thiodiazotropha sp. (ex Dulcina madagascariensis)]